MEKGIASRVVHAGVPPAPALRPLLQLDLVMDHPLLRGFSRPALESLVGPLRPNVLRARHLLPRPAGRGTEVHLILEGLLRGFELTFDGREAMVELIGPGGFDGFVAAAGRQARIIEALEDSLILSFHEAQIAALVTEPLIAARLTQLLLAMLRYREDQLRLTAVREPARRLALLLLMLSERFGRELGAETMIDCRLTHQMLADMVGFRRETVTHALHQLTRRGAVRTVAGRYLVNRRRLGQLGWPPGPPARYGAEARAYI